jgi:hypothetical protein
MRYGTMVSRCFKTYLIIAVVAFGHSYNNAKKCIAPFDKVQDCGRLEKTGIATASAIGWPLYWAIVAFEKIEL